MIRLALALALANPGRLHSSRPIAATAVTQLRLSRERCPTRRDVFSRIVETFTLVASEADRYAVSRTNCPCLLPAYVVLVDLLTVPDEACRYR